MVPVYNEGVMSRMGRDMISCAHTTQDNDRALAAYDAMLDLFV